MEMPLLGLGTWKLNGAECERVVKEALDLGYRHIDTADVYQNHEAIGRALKMIPRGEVFLTTKVSKDGLEPRQIAEAVPRFLEELHVDYLDLLLIHWPSPEVSLPDALKAMLEFQKQGIVRHIGVSNFVRSHLKELAPYHFPIFTNQIELHPYLQRRKLVEECKKMGISITAYRPLAKGAFEGDPVLERIGVNYGKSPSQIALRWIVQQGFAAIPKAGSVKHLNDNLAIFDFHLSEEEMDEIRKLDAGRRYCAPEGYPVFDD